MVGLLAIISMTAWQHLPALFTSIQYLIFKFKYYIFFVFRLCPSKERFVPLTFFFLFFSFLEFFPYLTSKLVIVLSS